jgi:hypothetical protein
MMSLMEKEFLAASDAFLFDKTDWVKLWYDPGHAIRSDCGKITAYRAITRRGQLLWYVFHTEKSRGYHASCSSPHAAIEEAQAVWVHRRLVKSQWSDVQRIAQDLASGKAKFDVRIEDAHASPLCTLGIDGFLSSVGLARVTRISGRMAALLMKLEPQMGFVIYEAWQRHKAAQKTEPKPHSASLPA